MPRYNLNHLDINTITEALDLLISKTTNVKDINRILHLKDRILSKITKDPSYALHSSE